MGKNCGHNCKYFYGKCYVDPETETLKFEDKCIKYNERYKEFILKYGDKTSDWVDRNIIMDCFEPKENLQLLDNMIQKVDKLLKDLDYE